MPRRIEQVSPLASPPPLWGRVREGGLRNLTVLLMLLVWHSTPVHAVQPDEILDDPVLEQRAREISKEVRCLVCRNESIDDSNAGLARDLRLLVRERVVAGDTNAEVKTYLVDRYGEFVLLQPVFSVANAALWIAGPLLFVLGLLVSIYYIRSRSPVEAQALSTKEQAELDRILKE